MPKSLDRAELEAAAEQVATTLKKDLGLTDYNATVVYVVTLSALRNIAKRAFEQASWRGVSNDMHARPLRVLGNPPVLLSDACAALEKPKDSAAAARKQTQAASYGSSVSMRAHQAAT